MRNRTKKIKIITCHDVYNLGASLQAYALSEYLVNLNNDVEIIDYKPEYLSNHYPLWGNINPVYDKFPLNIAYCLLKLPGRIIAKFSKRKKEFDYFTKNFLTLTSQRYYSNNELSQAPPYADIYIAGSDQIWNTFFQNGKDPAFYLDFAPDTAVKASYAASFATSDIIPEYKSFVKEKISHLDYISVRENSGLSILKDLQITNACEVLDPVFLLSKDQWIKLANKSDLKLSKPYVLVYDFDNNKDIADYAKKVAKEKNYEVYSIIKNSYININFENEGPLSFLYLILNARLVISNSFHATAFSLIFQKEFKVFNRNEGINSRMIDLVNKAGCLQCLSKEECGLIDFEKVNEKLNLEINKSKEFIDLILR